LHGSEQLKKPQYLFFEVLPGSVVLIYYCPDRFLKSKSFSPSHVVCNKKPPELSKHLRVLFSNSKSIIL
jgi:hypothetical protein